MALISDEEITAVRNRADIVEVIGHYLPVNKKGKSYVALCPFHDDHSPSMSISPDRQIYKCFVCGAGGNVFTFVQNFEKVSFPEAVAEVARLVGYPLSVDPAAQKKPEDPHRETLYRILDETIRYSMYQMNTEEGKQYRDYLEQRGLDQKTREQFQIGWLPARDQLYRFLHAKGYSDSDLVSVNVVRTSPGGLHDVFSDRITFPVHDPQGRPIGFSARTIDRNTPSKYRNTNDTELFRKGDLVYNYHRARGPARREGQMIICEGVTDVIAFWRAGIENCVCTLGTSCTEQQIRLLKSSAAELVFCYDGDQAGQNATWRAAKMAMAAGCQISVIRNDTGMDPDEILRKEGPEGLQQLQRQKLTWMEFAIEYLKKQTNFENYQERREFVRKAQAEIDTLTDELDRQHFTEVVGEISGFRLEYQKKEVPKQVRPRPAAARTRDGAEEAEELILAQMMAHPEAAARFEEKLGYLTDPQRNTAAMMVIDQQRRLGHTEPAALMDKAENEEIRRLLSRLATGWAYELPYDEKVFDGAVRKVRISIKEAQAEAIRRQLQQPMNATSREVLLKEYQECLIELRGYIDEENSTESN